MVISALVIITSMGMMYKAILARERGNDQYRFSLSRANRDSSSTTVPSRTNQRRCLCGANRNNRNLSTTMRRQGIWYSGAFLISFAPTVLIAVISPYWIYLVAAFTFNMIGFTNALVYIRPRFLSLRRENPHLSFVICLWYTVLRRNPPPTRRNHTITASTSTTGGAAFSSSTGLSSFFHEIFARVIKWLVYIKSSLTGRSGGAMTDEHLDEMGRRP